MGKSKDLAGLGGGALNKSLTVTGSANDANIFTAGFNQTNLSILADATDGELRISAEDASGNNYAKYMTLYTEGGSGPTERMRIDPSGRVTMPYQPMCDIYLNGNTTNAGPFTTYNVQVNVGNHWNSSTHRFTCPIAGRYEMTASAYTNYSTSYGWYGFYKNGSQDATMHWNHGGTGAHTMMGYSRIYDCSAGDYLQFGRPSGSGSSYFDITWLTVRLIG